jgi:2-isopropylmalate synthase
VPLLPSRGIEFFQRNETTPTLTDVQIFDTTLRDGEQAPHVSFSYADKREIAALLDEMGTHVIEAGFPANSDGEFEAVRDIADDAETTVAGLARVVEQDIEAALDAGVDMVHVFASTSDVQIADSMHSTREAVNEQSVRAVERVTEAGATCMFSPMDASRTDPDYLADVVSATSAAGADWINIPDTVGVCTPTRMRNLVEFVGEHTDADIDVHCHDDFGLAAANAVAGFEAGATQAQVAVNGIGERAGNAAFEEVVMAAEGMFDADVGIDTTRLVEISNLVEERSGVDVPRNKPVVGENAFSHESGIHAAGVYENTDTFEPGVMTPEMVGAQREFVLGKHTGTHSVREHLQSAGFSPTDQEVREVTDRVKEYGVHSQQITPRDVERFAREVGIDRQPEASAQ